VIGVVDFGSGNTRSVLRALEAVGAEARLFHDPAELEAAERLVFPGVGAAGSAMARLEGSGMADGLRGWVAAERPLFGICLGAQLLLDRSEEDGAPGLGVLAGACRRFPSPAAGGPMRTPHIGWNRVELASGGFDAYFVHGFGLAPGYRSVGAGWPVVDGFRFPWLRRAGALLGTQFHPEKSGAAGRALLAAWSRGLLDRAGDRAAVTTWS
jgi:imidazole glycerol phosphate synthase glutamine amidotransferase subunit